MLFSGDSALNQTYVIYFAPDWYTFNIRETTVFI